MEGLTMWVDDCKGRITNLDHMFEIILEIEGDQGKVIGIRTDGKRVTLYSGTIRGCEGFLSHLKDEIEIFPPNFERYQKEIFGRD